MSAFFIIYFCIFTFILTFLNFLQIYLHMYAFYSIYVFLFFFLHFALLFHQYVNCMGQAMICHSPMHLVHRNPLASGTNLTPRLLLTRLTCFSSSNQPTGFEASFSRSSSCQLLRLPVWCVLHVRRVFLFVCLLVYLAFKLHSSSASSPVSSAARSSFIATTCFT